MKTEGEGRSFAASVAAIVVLGLTGTSVVALATSPVEAAPPPGVARPASPVAVSVAAPVPAPATAAVQVPVETAKLPFGTSTIFPGHILVAYYGTAGTGALGVLGEADPDTITRKLRRAAKPFGSRNRKVQIVYELIVTVADADPGPDGDYSHDISRDEVKAYIDAAHRNRALLVLDIQPGRSDFLSVAKRWEWALKDPWVGLALDPEWRMAPGQVPAQVIGSVGAAEVNGVSRWLNSLAKANNLPEKVFMLHSFRPSMIQGIARIRKRKRLALVEHVDGFGTPGQKLATYHAVARPRTFHMGFKLFYDEDVERMNAQQVKRIRPVVEFVSFQ